MTGYIYLIGSPTFGWYKIGKSRKPALRVRNIGVLLPFKISVVALWLVQSHGEKEKELHGYFSERRINGEWFSLTKGDLAELFSIMGENLASDHRVLTDFSNLASDCPTGKELIVKTRKAYTQEQRDALKEMAISQRKERQKHRCPTCGRTLRPEEVHGTGPMLKNDAPQKASSTEVN